MYSNANGGISGVVAQDTVTVADVSVSLQFGAAQIVPGEWFYSDGLLALGWRAGSSSTWSDNRKVGNDRPDD